MSKFIKIENKSRRMKRYSLGTNHRIRATTTTREHTVSGSMAQRRNRHMVDQELIIPSGTTVEFLPGGDRIPSSIKTVPSIKAAIERREIVIHDIVQE